MSEDEEDSESNCPKCLYFLFGNNLLLFYVLTHIYVIFKKGKVYITCFGNIVIFILVLLQYKKMANDLPYIWLICHTILSFRTKKHN